jgi:hypothetical protein
MGDNWDWDPEKKRTARVWVAFIAMVLWDCAALAAGDAISALIITTFLATVVVAVTIYNNRR